MQAGATFPSRSRPPRDNGIKWSTDSHGPPHDQQPRPSRRHRSIRWRHDHLLPDLARHSSQRNRNRPRPDNRCINGLPHDGHNIGTLSRSSLSSRLLRARRRRSRTRRVGSSRVFSALRAQRSVQYLASALRPTTVPPQTGQSRGGDPTSTLPKRTMHKTGTMPHQPDTTPPHARRSHPLLP